MARWNIGKDCFPMEIMIEHDVLSVTAINFASSKLKASFFVTFVRLRHIGRRLLAKYALHFHCSEENAFSYIFCIFHHREHVLSVFLGS